MSLEKDLEKWVKSYSEGYCKQAASLITLMARDAIDLFYAQYVPIYYNRTDDLLHNSYSPYYHNNGRTIYGGVRINSDKMQPYKGAGITEHQIAYNAWQHGEHGFENKDPGQKIHTYPPIDMVRHAMGEKKFLDDLNKHALAVAKKEKYTSFFLR